MDPHLCVGVDVGCKAHRVGIADPDGQILEEFDVPHCGEGFDHFFNRVERHRKALGLPVAVAMKGSTATLAHSIDWYNRRATVCTT